MNKGWSIACSAVILTVLIMVGSCVQAAPKPVYFAQDDFVLTYGALGNPLAVGTNIDAGGRLLDWGADKILCWFTLTGQASAPGQVVGGESVLNMDQGTLTITTMRNGGGTVLWQGSVNSLQFKSHVNPAENYNASNYSRPAYESQASQYLSVGNGIFTRTGGSWTDPKMTMDWFGSYNWNYDGDTPQTSSYATGNLQGKLVVPEPGSIIALICGSVGLIGAAMRKRSR